MYVRLPAVPEGLQSRCADIWAARDSVSRPAERPLRAGNRKAVPAGPANCSARGHLPAGETRQCAETVRLRAHRFHAAQRAFGNRRVPEPGVAQSVRQEARNRSLRVSVLCFPARKRIASAIYFGCGTPAIGEPGALKNRMTRRLSPAVIPWGVCAGTK